MTMFFISVLSYSSNIVGEYVTKEVYAEGEKMFPNSKSQNIFLTKVYSMADAKKEREERIAQMKQNFLEVTLVTKIGNTMSATFFYKNEKGDKRRLTVSGRDELQIGKSKYLVTAEENGIRVKDLETEFELTIERKGR